jgi:hypothetical protein
LNEIQKKWYDKTKTHLTFNFNEIKDYIKPEYRNKVETWVRSKIKIAGTKNMPACPFHGVYEMEWDSGWYCSTKCEDGIICGFHPAEGKTRMKRYTMRKGRIPDYIKVQIMDLEVNKSIIVPDMTIQAMATYCRSRRLDGMKYKCRTTPDGVVVKRTK